MEIVTRKLKKDSIIPSCIWGGVFGIAIALILISAGLFAIDDNSAELHWKAIFYTAFLFFATPIISGFSAVGVAALCLMCKNRNENEYPN